MNDMRSALRFVVACPTEDGSNIWLNNNQILRCLDWLGISYHDGLCLHRNLNHTFQQLWQTSPGVDVIQNPDFGTRLRTSSLPKNIDVTLGYRRTFRRLHRLRILGDQYHIDEALKPPESYWVPVQIFDVDLRGYIIVSGRENVSTKHDSEQIECVVDRAKEHGRLGREELTTVE
ncbi:hypothetical protein BDN67DRAFT_318776 [Paxillus ammoniavirescens]|nr:hypothetical protein BDN67DRAFT_318776 [Paxillus ammoniavirescens]